jgi:hypothetical protein
VKKNKIKLGINKKTLACKGEQMGQVSKTSSKPFIKSGLV